MKEIIKHSENKTDLLCIGVSIVDCVIKGFNAVPLTQRGYFTDSANLTPGGEAVNQSVTASKLGLNTEVLIALGKDYASDILLTELKKNNVGIQHVISESSIHTPVTTIFIDVEGNRKSITTSAHRFNFYPERYLPDMTKLKAISLGSLFRAPFNNTDTVAAVLSEAKSYNVLTFADTKMPNDTPLQLCDFNGTLSMIDFIFPNLDEALYYSKAKNAEDAADTFLSYGIKNVIIKLGAKGCLFKNNSTKITIPGYRINAVDATGAGDNFIAGFIFSYLNDNNISNALSFANACGAVSTTHIGATTALTDANQIIHFMQNNTPDFA